ncbi:MAG: PTS sugar transporter subunit IIB, partial [Ligilactobacillus sp.]|nr:PTS sugar transporter subunit IIB [Ligilactobacillus sp.]
DKKTLKSLGAVAVLEIGGGIQAVFGGKADLFSQEINQILGKGD